MYHENKFKYFSSRLSNIKMKKRERERERDVRKYSRCNVYSTWRVNECDENHISQIHFDGFIFIAHVDFCLVFIFHLLALIYLTGFLCRYIFLLHPDWRFNYFSQDFNCMWMWFFSYFFSMYVEMFDWINNNHNSFCYVRATFLYTCAQHLPFP